MLIDDAEKAQILSRVERLQALMAELEQAATALDRATIRDRMKRELEAAKQAVKQLGTHNP
jgi:DNA invertase Pin-like site-specific DNA recombinase